MPAPETWENLVAPYSIRVPKPSAPAAQLPAMFQHLADDVSAALQAAAVSPAPNANVHVALSDPARDAYYGTPATAATRRALQDSGALCIRPDLGGTQRYYAGPTDGGANPGGRSSAGWYREDGGPVAMVPTAAAVGGGTATIGHAGVVTLNLVTGSLSLSNLFDPAFRQHIVEWDFTHTSTSVPNLRLRSGSTDAATNYDRVRSITSGTTAAVATLSASTSLDVGVIGAAGRNFGRLILRNAAIAAPTAYTCDNTFMRNPLVSGDGFNSTNGQHRDSTAFDGLSFLIGVGAVSGVVRAWGVL